MEKELLKRVRKIVYYLDTETGDTPPVAVAVPTVETPAPNIPGEFDFDEIPSRLFDGLFFLPSRLTVRYGEVVSQKCHRVQFQLLWYLESFDGTADLEAAAISCLGKKIGEDITLKSMQNNFYRIDKIFIELEIKSTIAVTPTTATINR